MPCYDPRGEVEGAREDLNERTAMLCETLKRWEKAGKPFELTDRVAAWWKEHKRWDRERESARAATKRSGKKT